MSDISIPGVSSSSGIDTEKMIQDLMEVEKVKLDRMEDDRDKVSEQREAWQEINIKLSRLRDSSKSLFSYQNPFNDRSAVSSNDAVLTAIAGRDAVEGQSELTVKQPATRDRFLSTPVDGEYSVRPGTYGFAVGDKEIRFNFKGGSLEDLEREIKENAQDLVNAKVFRNTQTTKVISIEATATGAQNTLTFLDDALSFAADIGILKPTDNASRTMQLQQTSVRRWDKPLTNEVIRFEGGKLVFPAGGEASIPLTPPVKSRENLTLEIEIDVKLIPYDYTPPQPPPGPDTPEPGTIAFRGIEIRNETSRAIVPDWEPPSPPIKTDDLNVLYISSENQTIPLPPISAAEGKQTIKIPLFQYADVLSAVNIRNNNTHREITISSIRTHDPSTRGDYVPVNPVETAADAVLLIDGIEITRPGNAIDDLIPGVTLNVQSASDKPIVLSVEPDRTAIKGAIIEFVFTYDRLLEDINILTGRDSKIVDEITYLNDDERDAAKEKLGLFQGDFTLINLKSKLQTYTMNAYSTSEGGNLALLAQIGISTSASRTGSASLDPSRLRGYLEVNEDLLDESLENRLYAIKELFGKDTDGDLIIDSGVAVMIDSYAKPFVETGGFISNKISNINDQIARVDDNIEDYKEKMARNEQEYRKKFGAMEAALNSLDQSSQQISNFSNSQRDEQ